MRIRIRRPRLHRDFILLLLDGQRYRLIEDNGPGPLGSFDFGGKSYRVEASKRRLLRGYWHPLDRIGFFSDLLARDGVTRSLTVFPKPDSKVPNETILALDRLTQTLAADALTPQVHRAWFVSPLYRDRMRRLKIGVVNIRTLLLALVVIGVILGVLYFSGYLGG